MAKELPYFKFEPAEWQNGNIQMLPPEIRAIYIDLCCVYWQRLGELPYAFALQRHCGGNKNALQTMNNVEVLHAVEGENIRIEWLDEQLEERKEKSVKASKSASKRWGKKKVNANGMRTHSERNANRREEKRKEENISFGEFWDLYDKKRGDKVKIKKKWLALTDAERLLVMEYIPKYKESQPNKRYRKDPATFLNNKSWNDELLDDDDKPETYTFNDGYTLTR